MSLTWIINPSLGLVSVIVQHYDLIWLTEWKLIGIQCAKLTSSLWLHKYILLDICDCIFNASLESTTRIIIRLALRFGLVQWFRPHGRDLRPFQTQHYFNLVCLMLLKWFNVSLSCHKWARAQGEAGLAYEIIIWCQITLPYTHTVYNCLSTLHILNSGTPAATGIPTWWRNKGREAQENTKKAVCGW